MNSEATDIAKLANKLRPEKFATDRRRSGKGPVDSGPFDIRIATDGNWYYRGSLIERKPLVKLFSSVLMCDESGQFWMQTPAEKGLIEVEDAPFVIVQATTGPGTGREQIVHLTTNIDETVTLDRTHPLRVAVNPNTGEPRPYVSVRGRLEARVGRAVYYDLVAMAVREPDPAGDQLGVWSAGTFHSLGRVTSDS